MVKMRKISIFLLLVANSIVSCGYSNLPFHNWGIECRPYSDHRIDVQVYEMRNDGTRTYSLNLEDANLEVRDYDEFQEIWKFTSEIETFEVLVPKVDENKYPENYKTNNVDFDPFPGTYGVGFNELNPDGTVGESCLETHGFP